MSVILLLIFILAMAIFVGSMKAFDELGKRIGVRTSYILVGPIITVLFIVVVISFILLVGFLG